MTFLKSKLSETDLVIAKDTGLYFLSKLFPGALVFLGIFLFNRTYGSALFGKYSLIVSVASTAAAFSGSWLTQSLLKFVSRDSQGKMNWVTVEGTLIAVGVSCTFIAVFSYIRNSLSLDVFLSLIFGAVLVVYNVFLAELMAAFKSASVLKVEILRNILFIAVPISFFYSGFSTNGLVAGVILSYLLTYIVGRTEISGFRVGGGHLSKFVMLKKYFSFGWPLSLSLGLLEGFRLLERGFLDSHINSAILGNYVTVSEVLLRSFSLLFVPLTMALHPRFMLLWNEGERKSALQVLKKIAGAQIGIFILVVCGLVLFGKWVFKSLFPNISDEIISLMIPIATSGFIWQVNAIVHKPLEAAGRSKIILIGYILALGGQLLTYYLSSELSEISIYPKAQIIGSLVYLMWTLAYLFFRRRTVLV